MQNRESDWNKFTALKALALERFCVSILDQSIELCGKKDSTAHRQYLLLYNYIVQCDKDIRDAFDGHSRSRAELQLQLMFWRGLVTEEELSEFSEETQSYVRSRET